MLLSAEMSREVRWQQFTYLAASFVVRNDESEPSYKLVRSVTEVASPKPVSECRAQIDLYVDVCPRIPYVCVSRGVLCRQR